MIINASGWKKRDRLIVVAFVPEINHFLKIWKKRYWQHSEGFKVKNITKLNGFRCFSWQCNWKISLIWKQIKFGKELVHKTAQLHFVIWKKLKTDKILQIKNNFCTLNSHELSLRFVLHVPNVQLYVVIHEMALFIKYL